MAQRSTAEARAGSGAKCDGAIFEMATEANARSCTSLAAVRVHEGGGGRFLRGSDVGWWQR